MSNELRDIAKATRETADALSKLNGSFALLRQDIYEIRRRLVDIEIRDWQREKRIELLKDKPNWLKLQVLRLRMWYNNAKKNGKKEEVRVQPNTNEENNNQESTTR